jgi:hypothetical protein
VFVPVHDGRDTELPQDGRAHVHVQGMGACVYAPAAHDHFDLSHLRTVKERRGFLSRIEERAVMIQSEGKYKREKVAVILAGGHQVHDFVLCGPRTTYFIETSSSSTVFLARLRLSLAWVR